VTCVTNADRQRAGRQGADCGACCAGSPFSGSSAAAGASAQQPFWWFRNLVVHLREARIEGERLSFVLIDDADHFHRLRFEGIVRGDAIEGTARGSGSAPRRQLDWKARRLPH